MLVNLKQKINASILFFSLFSFECLAKSNETVSSRLFNYSFSIGAFGYLFLFIFFLIGIIFLFTGITKMNGFGDQRTTGGENFLKILAYTIVGAIMASYTSYFAIMSATTANSDTDNAIQEFKATSSLNINNTTGNSN